MLQRWDENSRFKTYLATVTINRAIDYYRGSGTRPIGGVDIPDPPGEDDAVGHALEQQIKELVERALELLTGRYPECPKMLKLRYFHDFSYEQIADAMDQTINQVGV